MIKNTLGITAIVGISVFPIAYALKTWGGVDLRPVAGLITTVGVVGTLAGALLVFGFSRS